MTSPSTEMPAGVDPAFTAAERPALYTQNIPAEGEVAALLGDRERLHAFLAHGYRLYRNATSRTFESARTRSDPGRRPDGTEDPSFGQRSNDDSRKAWLDHYQWLHHFGPCLLLLVDHGLLGGKVEQEYRAARAAG